MKGLKSALGKEIDDESYQNKGSESFKVKHDGSSIWTIAEGLDA